MKYLHFHPPPIENKLWNRYIYPRCIEIYIVILVIFTPYTLKGNHVFVESCNESKTFCSWNALLKIKKLLQISYLNHKYNV